MPTNVAARMTLAADPGSLQGAVAAGILGCGPVILGTAEECARLLQRGARARRRPGGGRQRDGARSAARRQAARLRPSRAQAARPARRADPRARRRARRQPAARRAGARVPRRGRRGLGPAADDERLDADRRGDARPRLPAARGQGGPDPRPHREPARPPGRGARAADRLPAWPAPPRRRSSTSASPSWDEQLASTTVVPRAARLPARALAVLPREARPAHDAVGGLDDIAALPLTEKRELRATVDRREPDRRAPVRRARARSSASTRRAARPARRATSR